MSLKIKLREPGRTGLCTIIFQVIENRKVKMISSRYRVLPHQFKDGAVIKHADATLINLQLEKQRAAILQTLTEDGVDGLTPFSVAIKKLLDRYVRNSEVTAYNKLLGHEKNVLACWGKDPLISRITREMVDDFINYLYSERHNAKSTVKKVLKSLGAVLVEVEYTGKNFFMLAAKKIKPDPVQREKLTAEEIKALSDIELSGNYDLARDMFLFSFYAHGMRFENVATMERSQVDKFVQYRMNKGKKIREVEITPHLQAIINKYPGKDKYLFPLVKKQYDAWTKKEVIGGANAIIRIYLKGAAIKAGINKQVHFHMARHSFAYLSLIYGVNMNVIKDSLGHSNFATTEAYIKSLSDKHINNAVRGMYDEM